MKILPRAQVKENKARVVHTTHEYVKNLSQKSWTEDMRNYT
jgi:hypothetical protein